MNIDLDEFVNMGLKLLGKSLVESALLQAALARAEDAAAKAAAEIVGLKAYIANLEQNPTPEVH